MATRESLKKLNKNQLKQICNEIGGPTDGKRKDEIISNILTSQVPVSKLTPVARQSSHLTGIFPTAADENLPPFNATSFSKAVSSDLPSPSFLQIYNFMINRSVESTQDGRTVQNFKGMDRAVRHFDAGDVQDIQISFINDSVVYIKAMCLASMKKDRYTVYISITLSLNGHVDNIQYAYCQCPVGLGQSCSHIGAVLFALNGKQRLEELSKSCTSKPCEWIKPRQFKQDPLPVTALRFTKPKLDGEEASSSQTIKDFDPRHPDDRQQDMPKLMEQLKELKKTFPETGMTHLWNIPDHAPEATCEMEIISEQDLLYEKMEKMLFFSQNFPPVNIDENLQNYIEDQTKRQRLSEMWKKLHIGRITSSIFGDVINAGANPNSLIKHIVEGCSLDRYSSLPPAVQWGIESEEKARQDYLNLKSALNPDISVNNTGLTLCQTHSFLGASSDGRVSFTDDGTLCTGILEIKCPYSVKGNKVNKMEVLDIVSLNNSDFCLEICNDSVSLKKTHKYYAQIQGEMAIMSMTWCDFVLWTDSPQNNIFIQRIDFDPIFVTHMMPQLVEFYMKHIFPVFYE